MGSLIDASTTSQEYEENITVTLKQHSHLNYVIFSYLNINSIRNKFGDLDKTVDGNVDILCIAERRKNESFPSNQFVYQYNQSMYTGYHRKQRWLDGIS